MSWIGRANVWGESGPAGSFSYLVGYILGVVRGENTKGVEHS